MFVKNKNANISDDTLLWRYMSYSKFLSMLKTSSLYFCRIDCFDDKKEASQTVFSKQFARCTENPWQMFYYQHVDKQLEIYKNLTYASCWHINTHENERMWKNYASLHGNEGVAVRTTFKALSESFITNKRLTNLRMKYIDYQTQFIDYSYPDYQLLLSIKDMAYAYENELRIIILEDYPEYDDDCPSSSKLIETDRKKGEEIKVNLNKLIRAIYLSPDSTTRFRDLIIQDTKQYRINPKVVRSELYGKC